MFFFCSPKQDGFIDAVGVSIAKIIAYVSNWDFSVYFFHNNKQQQFLIIEINSNLAVLQISFVEMIHNQFQGKTTKSTIYVVYVAWDL